MSGRHMSLMFFDQPATSYGMESSLLSLFWNLSISSSFIS
jgi:hypothetical protein